MRSSYVVSLKETTNGQIKLTVNRRTKQLFILLVASHMYVCKRRVPSYRQCILLLSGEEGEGYPIYSLTGVHAMFCPGVLSRVGRVCDFLLSDDAVSKRFSFTGQCI